MEDPRQDVLGSDRVDRCCGVDRFDAELLIWLANFVVEACRRRELARSIVIKDGEADSRAAIGLHIAIEDSRPWGTHIRDSRTSALRRRGHRERNDPTPPRRDRMTTGDRP